MQQFEQFESKNGEWYPKYKKDNTEAISHQPTGVYPPSQAKSNCEKIKLDLSSETDTVEAHGAMFQNE